MRLVAVTEADGSRTSERSSRVMVPMAPMEMSR